MSFDSLCFLIKRALKSIFQNWLLTLASVTVLCVCLVFLGISMLSVKNVNVFIDEIGNENQVVLFLDEDLDANSNAERIGQIESELRGIGNIKNVYFKSKAESLEEYKSLLGDDSSWLSEDLTDDVLRASFVFEVEDLSKFEQTMYAVEKIEGIARIRERRDIVESIQRVRGIVMFFSFWIILLLVVVSVLVITNSVKVSVYSRKHELNIMKYVGATDIFVQLPYFLEGIIIGVFSGILSTVLLSFTYTRLLSPTLAEIGFFTPVPFSSVAAAYTLFFVIVGGAVGMLGSVFPVKKYLNV